MCKLKLFSVIDQLPLPAKTNSQFILALPEWDYHELGILYYHYLLKKAGYPATYLGQAVPADNVVQTAKTVNAQHIIMTFIGPTTEKEIKVYLDKIIENTTGTHLFISGPHVSTYNNRQPKNVTVFMSMDTLVKKFNLKD
jgi:methanogenic corrinoid protein MtbC1